MNLYACDMVSVTVQLNDDVMKKLEARAAEAGTTVPELIAQLVDVDEGPYDFTPEEEQQIIDSAAQADRGEVVSAEEAMAQLRALGR